MIAVNNVGYQAMVDLSPGVRGCRTPRSSAPRTAGMSQYDVPLLLKPQPQNVF